MNLPFILLPLFWCKIESKSHQNRPNMQHEIPPFFRHRFWSNFELFLLLFSSVFAVSWRPAIHFTNNLKTQISLQIPMNSQSRSRSNFTNFAKNQWTSVSFFWYLFSSKKNTKTTPEINPNIDTNRCLGNPRTHVKKHVRKLSLFDATIVPSLWPLSIQNREKRATLKGGGVCAIILGIFMIFGIGIRFFKKSIQISMNSKVLF